jgi:hypothetical protein
MQKRLLPIAGFMLLAPPAISQAAYMLTPSSGGSNSITVAPGGSFSLDMVLTSDGADSHNSSLWSVTFSEPGLTYQSYDWQLPYVDGTSSDDSNPHATDLPTTITAASLNGPPGVVDIELTNRTPVAAPLFTTGNLITLSLTVPLTYSGSGTVLINVVPDTFANGFDDIQTTAGQQFTLNVSVPEPATAGVLLLGGALLAGRRRRRV